MSRCLSCIHYCSACGAEIHTWMGMSVVECPKCGKVML